MSNRIVNVSGYFIDLLEISHVGPLVETSHSTSLDLDWSHSYTIYMKTAGHLQIRESALFPRADLIAAWRQANEIATYDQAFNTALEGILRNPTALTDEQMVWKAHGIAVMAVLKRREVYY